MVKVEFKYDPADQFTPRIVPASQALPDWYKDMPLQRDYHKDEPWEAGTVKTCMPFLDAMIQGYIIPLWSDLHVSPGPKFTWLPEGRKVIAAHAEGQVPSDMGQPFKFLNPWIIKTPKGYSSLFTAPLNQENPLFKIVSAIVSTDEYFHHINFPFFWTGGDWTGTIPQGTPLVHILPFKRVDYEHESKPLTPSEKDTVAATVVALRSSFRGVYKRLWRQITRST